MTWRQTFRKFIRLTGFEVVRASHWGLDPMQDLRRLLGNGRHTFLDVGANIGQAAHQLIRTFPGSDVYSFEPIPDMVTALRTLAKSIPGLHVVPVGLGSAAGELTMNVAEASEGSSFLPLRAQARQFGAWTTPKTTILAPVRRLDAIMTELGITHADLLKVDTQGFDLEVLKGAGALLVPDKIRAVLVEVCFEPFYEGAPRPYEVMSFMELRGYRPVAMYEGGRERGGRLYWADMMFA